MLALKLAKCGSAAIVAAVLLAGCASTPAPVSNYSFGPNGQPASPTTATSSSATTAATGNGVKTYGIGGHASAAPLHAHGTVGAGGYTVAAGDTMYSIAFAHGMDVRDLAALNGIAPPYVIHPGQVLKLQPGPTTTAAPVVATAPTPATAPVPPPPTAVASTPPAASANATAPSGAPVFGAVTTQPMTANGVAPASAASVAAAPTVSAPAAPVPPPPAASAPSVAAPTTTPNIATPPPGATRAVAGITWQWPASGKVLSGFQPGGTGEGAGLNIAGNLGDPVRAAAAGTVVYSGDGLIGYGELIIIKHNDTYLSAYGHNSKRLVKEGEHVAAGQEIALMGASGASRVELHFEIRKDGKPVDPMGYLPQK